MSQQNKRVAAIDVARAIAAFLVVFEHMVEFFPRYGMRIFEGHYQDVFSIYLVKYFHISIFILISGILLGASYRKVSGAKEYLRFEHKKFLRLMLPYFSIALLQLMIKVVSSSQGLAEVPNAVLGTLVAPHAGGMPHGWFLVSLMTIFLLWPLMKPLLDGNAFVIVLSGLIVLAILPISWPKYQGQWTYFELDRTVWYLPIFVIGYWYGRRVFRHKQPGFLWALLAGTIFLIAFTVHRLTSWPGSIGWMTLSSAVQWVGYLAAGFFVIWLCGVWCRKMGSVRSSFAWIGLYAFDIYLLHVMVGHITVFALGKLNLNGAVIYLLPAVLAVPTLLIALGIGQMIRRSPYLAFVMLGEPLKKSSDARSWVGISNETLFLPFEPGKTGEKS